MRLLSSSFKSILRKFKHPSQARWYPTDWEISSRKTQLSTGPSTQAEDIFRLKFVNISSFVLVNPLDHFWHYAVLVLSLRILVTGNFNPYLDPPGIWCGSFKSQARGQQMSPRPFKSHFSSLVCPDSVPISVLSSSLVFLPWCHFHLNRTPPCQRIALILVAMDTPRKYYHLFIACIYLVK